MRTLSLWIAFFVVIAPPGCASHLQEPQPTSESKRGVKPADVEAAYAELQKSLGQVRGNLESVRATDTSGPCRNARGFTASSVSRTYEIIRGRAFAPVESPEAAPLRELLVRRFPEMPKERNSCFAAVDAIDEGSVSGFLSNVDAFLIFARRNAKPMTVVVYANKPKAVANLHPSSGGVPQPDQFTTATFDEQFRGIYSLTVRKDGFKKFDDEIGELAKDKVKIWCDLVADGNAGESICAEQR